jgi:hypothetical protein
LNLRPSGYEPDELPGCSIPRHYRTLCLSICRCICLFYIVERYVSVFIRCGNDLLSHVLRRSTISAVALNCRVRDGIGCFAHAMITTPKKHRPRGILSPAFSHQRPAFSRKPSFKSAQLMLWCVCILIWSVEVLLLLDQIKPIGPLVPVN